MFDVLQDLFPTYSLSTLQNAVAVFRKRHPDIEDDGSLVDRVVDFLLSAGPNDLENNDIVLLEPLNDTIPVEEDIPTIDLSNVYPIENITEVTSEKTLKRSSDKLIDLTAEIEGRSKKQAKTKQATSSSSSSSYMPTEEGVKMLEELFPDAEKSFLQQIFIKARLHDKQTPVNYASSMIFDLNNDYPKRKKQSRASSSAVLNEKPALTIEQYKAISQERGEKMRDNPLYQVCASQVLLMAFPLVPRSYVKLLLNQTQRLFTPAFYKLDDAYRARSTTPLPFVENVTVRNLLQSSMPPSSAEDFETSWFEDDSDDKNFDFSAVPPKPAPIPLTHRLPLTTTEPIVKVLKQLNIPKVDDDFLTELKTLQQALRDERSQHATDLRRHYLYKHAVKTGTILECGCCFGDTIAEEASQCTEAHVFCAECMQRATDVLCGSGRIETGWSRDEIMDEDKKGKKKACDPPVRWIMKCIWSEGNGCVRGFTEKTLRKVVKEDVLNGYLRRLQEDDIRQAIVGGESSSSLNTAVAVIAGKETEDYPHDGQGCYFCFVSCPFCDYGAVMERPPQEDKIFICLNPSCRAQTCRLCGRENHIPLNCKEAAKEDILSLRHKMEEAMTEALLRYCWKCKKKFYKTEGCNKMTCVCGAMMCYICREPVKDYSHFNQPGEDEDSKCALFDDTEKRNAEDALRGAEEAEKRLREELVERGFAENELEKEQKALKADLKKRLKTNATNK